MFSTFKCQEPPFLYVLFFHKIPLPLIPPPMVTDFCGCQSFGLLVFNCHSCNRHRRSQVCECQTFINFGPSNNMVPYLAHPHVKLWLCHFCKRGVNEANFFGLINIGLFYPVFNIICINSVNIGLGYSCVYHCYKCYMKYIWILNRLSIYISD